MPSETARRLACDASVVRNGRKTRTIPPALRRRYARDRGCRFPGCENRRFLDAHHVHHWARGGETTADNLVLLCRRHHRLVHEGGWHVDPELRFHDGGGSRFRRCRACRAAIPMSSSPTIASCRSTLRPASLARMRLSTWLPQWTRCSRSLRSPTGVTSKNSLRSLGNPGRASVASPPVYETLKHDPDDHAQAAGNRPAHRRRVLGRGSGKASPRASRRERQGSHRCPQAEARRPRRRQIPAAYMAVRAVTVSDPALKPECVPIGRPRGAVSDRR